MSDTPSVHSDPSTTPNLQNAPPACPACGKGAGRVRAAAFGAGQRTLTYVCDRCHHSWTANEPDHKTLFG